MLEDGELSPSDLVGGKYRLIELVGSGAMGSVWSAQNEMTQRNFALKVMNRQAALDPTAVQRFLQEARAAGSLRHPAIVEVYDVGYHDSGVRGLPAVPYLVMELLEGETLEQRLTTAGQLPPDAVIAFLHTVASGLSVAHAAGIVHRDLKPANLFFHGPGRLPKVLDFGISKLLSLGAGDGVLTVAGLVLGSPPYMSPEQAGGKLDVDARSDVWALGVITYRALSGRLPFAAPNYNALMLEIIHTAPVPIRALCPDLDARLAGLVMACLEKERERRPADAGELARLLSAAFETGSGPMAMTLREPEVARRSRLSRPVLGAATLALVALAVIASRLMPSAHDQPSKPELTPEASPRVAAAATSERLPSSPETASAIPAPPALSVAKLPAKPSSSSSTKRGAKATPSRVESKSAPKGDAKGKGPAGAAMGDPKGPPPVNEGVTSPGL